MDLSTEFQLKEKKVLWMDVILYFSISLLVATIFCYFVFLIKNVMQQEQINEQALAFETVGTDTQKEQEKIVLNAQKKINDFNALFKNHSFASNVFTFLEEQTRINIWFKQFRLNQSGASVQLSGQADDLEALSRQVAVFEQNKYVKNVGVLNSSLSDKNKITFNINLVLDNKIFDYVASLPSASETDSEISTEDINQEQVQQ